MLTAVAWRVERSGPGRPAAVAGASIVTFADGKRQAGHTLPNPA
jgi:hypothetical protein